MTDYREWLRDDAIAIFLFHGVVPARGGEVRNYTLKHLDADSFRAICESLRDAGTPVAPDEALALLAAGGGLPPSPFVISFDDGFRNNLTVAAPILEALGLPAVFYCTSSFVRDNGASWIDLIEDAVARTDEPALELPWSGGPRPCRSASERIALLEEVRRVVKSSPDSDPYAVAAELRERAGVGEFEPDPDLDQKLTVAEVGELASHELFTVGGHGHTHRVLTHLGPAELERELSLSLEVVGEALGEPVRHYSYPEGTPDAYSDEVIEALRRRGIVSSPTAEPGVNPPGADPFRLKRITVDRLPG